MSDNSDSVVISYKDYSTIVYDGAIDNDGVNKLIYNLRSFIKKDITCIILEINSYGGDVDDGLRAYDFIKQLLNDNIAVYCINTGDCSSAATLPFLAVPVEFRYMYENATFLLHNSKIVRRTAIDINVGQNINDQLIKIQEFLKGLYTREMKHLPKTVMSDILTKDVIFGKKEAIDYGLVNSTLLCTSQKLLPKKDKEDDTENGKLPEIIKALSGISATITEIIKNENLDKVDTESKTIPKKVRS